MPGETITPYSVIRKLFKPCSFLVDVVEAFGYHRDDHLVNEHRPGTSVQLATTVVSTSKNKLMFGTRDRAAKVRAVWIAVRVLITPRATHTVFA